MIKMVTKNAAETKKVARALAREIVRAPAGRRARVLALSGELGAGKTTFTQGFATALGIKEKIKSPTFVLVKIYDLRHAAGNMRHGFKHLIHIDCYRISSPKDLIHLGLRDLLKDKDAIILIEWPERIKKILPSHTRWLRFKYGKQSNGRSIDIN